jgi:UDP-glucose 4-epimerase
MAKVVVFGGSGFLGSHVADELTKRGYEVIIFDRFVSKYLRGNQQMVIGNILDRENVKSAVMGSDFVYHFAAIADIHEARENPVEAANYNIMGTIFILDACREFGIKRFIYSSTIYVYSDHGSFYRSTKQSCELFIENYQKEYNLDFTVLRYGSLYGPRANHFNFINNIIRQALIDKKINRLGDGSEVREYINVIDAATASVDVLESDYKNCYVMITGPQTMKVKEILEMIREILNYEIEIEYQLGEISGHYLITPYSFKPKVALKLIPKNYHDLGQGILDCIYENYQSLKAEGKEIAYNKIEDRG